MDKTGRAAGQATQRTDGPTDGMKWSGLKVAPQGSGGTNGGVRVKLKWMQLPAGTGTH